MATPHVSSHPVPVFSGPRCLEFASPARVRRLVQASKRKVCRGGKPVKDSNVEIVTKHKTGEVVQINLLHYSDDSAVPAIDANPRRYSHDHENETNPQGVWTLRKLGGRHCPACGARLHPEWLRCACGQVTIAGMFRQSVLDTLKRAKKAA